MPKPKSNTPKFLEPPKRSVLREIKALRKLIRQTRAQMRSGQIDHAHGGALITHSCNSIARLLVAEHRITPPQEHNPFIALRREYDRMLRELGYGPEEDQGPPA
jgi:hypothetical protein